MRFRRRRLRRRSPPAKAQPTGFIEAPEDGSQPDGYPIKGNADSMLYHVPGSAFYDRTVAEVWFATEADAEAAGYSLPKSQQHDDTETDTADAATAEDTAARGESEADAEPAEEQ